MHPIAGLKVFGYPRVSTDGQVLDGNSMKDQPIKIRAFCATQGLDLVDMVEDGGECSKTLDRPGLQEILARLRAGEAHGIVVTHLDRLTRHVGDMIGLVEEFFMEPGRCHLFACDQTIQTRTAAGRFLVYVQILMSQYVREIIVENTNGAMAGKRSRSERTGNLKFGQSVDPTDSRRSKSGLPVALIDCQQDLEILRTIHELRDAGLTLRAIAESLNDLGIPSKRGVTRRSTGKWSKSTISEILRREVDELVRGVP